jgi:spoIIIJ-associated protein
MADQPSHIELDVPAGDIESAVAQVCAGWGVERSAVELETEAATEGGLVHVTVRRHDPALERARATLGELLQHLGVEAAVHAAWGPGDPVTGVKPIVLDVRGEDLAMLIGRHGETLAALQYITRLILARQLGEGLELTVDVQGHKRRREEQLRRMARRIAEQAAQRKRVMTLEPMSAYERRIIHLELRDHPDVRTESVGEGMHRKVTIIPK